MNFCKNCGASLEPGRFCTNCGAPVDAPRSDAESAAEKTSVRLPAVQPDASSGTRYPLYAAPPPQQAPEPKPLFADEVPTRSPDPAPSQQAPHQQAPHLPHGQGQPGQQAPYAGAWPPPAWEPPAGAAEAGGSHRSEESARRSPLIWLLPLLLVAVAVVGVGIWLGTRGDDDPSDASGSDDPKQSQAPSATSDPTDTPSEPEDPSPTEVPEPPADAVDLTAQTAASGPKPLKPGVDLAGNKVRYPASNMLDGDPATAYRLGGDASGESITLDLPDETTVYEVGLINGYAKTDTVGNRTVNWYEKNRRITEVEWSFDDGTVVTQTLRDSTDLQVIAVDGAVTRTITLRIVSVSAPGKGDLSKNVTAISSVSLRGEIS